MNNIGKQHVYMKKRIEVKWPEQNIFTFEDIVQLNPKARQITLRVHLSKMVKSKKIIEIGERRLEIGRPRKIYTFAEKLVGIDFDSLQKQSDINIIHEFIEKLSGVKKDLINKT